MEILLEVAEIRLNNNYDGYNVLQSLKEKGFEIRHIPTDESCFKYGILTKIDIKTAPNYFDQQTAVDL